MIEDLQTWIYTKIWTQEGKNKPRNLTQEKKGRNEGKQKNGMKEKRKGVLTLS